MTIVNCCKDGYLRRSEFFRVIVLDVRVWIAIVIASPLNWRDHDAFAPLSECYFGSMQRRTKTNLRKRSAVTKASPSSSAPQETALELAKRLGLIGKAKHLPRDLSTNTEHLEGFGEAL